MCDVKSGCTCGNDYCNDDEFVIPDQPAVEKSAIEINLTSVESKVEIGSLDLTN